MTLEVLWYCVIILCMICYAILDGFDLGVGCLHLFAKKDIDRRIFLNAIGPVWDGNEVWLVIIIGALFAGFPGVYATLLSAFYNPLMVFISGLIFRAAAIEFRSKMVSSAWRLVWDVVFAASSFIIAFGVGVVLANLIKGISLDANQDFVGNTSEFLHPYALLLGVTTAALFTMHGAIYLVMKTEGALHNRLHRWVNKAIVFFILSYLATTAATLFYMPHMTHQMQQMPGLFLIPLLAFGSIVNIPFQMRKKNDGWAFISSAFSIALLLSLFAIGTFPTMIRSTINPEQFSLVIGNSASSQLTLKILLIIVAIGIPMVLAYGSYLYRIFRGKVKLDKNSY